MTEKQMNEALLAAFPELNAELKDYVSWQDGMETGAFLTYEDVFRPHIENAITEGDKLFLGRVSEFIEQLFMSGDDYAVNVITVGILEGLKANCNAEDVREFLAPECLKEFEAITY